jgi:hypothetical protein
MKATATNPHVRHERSSRSSASARGARVSGACAGADGVDAEEEKVDVNNTKALQRRLTSAQDEAAIAGLFNECELDGEDSKHGERRATTQLRILKAAGRPDAKRWLYVLPQDPRLELNKWEFEQCIRLLFGAPLGQTRADDRCPCDNSLLSSLPSDHIMCCRVLRSATTARHNRVVNALKLIAERLGLSTHVEPEFRDGEHRERPDLEIQGGGIHVLVDVTFAHSSSPSAGANEVAVRAASKAGKYDLSMMKAGADEVIAFAVESHGALGKEAEDLLRRLAEVGAREIGVSPDLALHQFKDTIAIAIQSGHASLVDHAQRQIGCSVFR